MEFKVPEVNAKYKSLLGEADPIVHVVVGYSGPLSGAPLAAADKMFENGGTVELKDAKAAQAAPSDKGDNKGAAKEK